YSPQCLDLHPFTSSFSEHVGRDPRSTLVPYTTLFRSELSAGKVYTSDSDTHHMKNVMRFKPGQEFHMVDIGRTTFLCEVTDTDDRVHYKVVSERSEEHTSELQSRFDLVCRLLLEKKKT